jgi:ligand-binding sensor domain-containing protein
MHYRRGLTLMVSFISLVSYAQIGTWKDHLNYNNAFHIALLDNEVYVASDNGIFIYNKDDNSVSKLSKVNGLSDIGITAIRANEALETILVGYENGNLDVIRDRTISNFTAIKNSSVIGDKTIRHIHYLGSQAFISTGVGIISFNLDRLEVSDTYQILSDGSPSVNEVTILNDTMFAATDEGLFMGALSEDLTVFENWTQELSNPAPFQKINNVSSVGGILYLNFREGDVLGTYRRSDNEWLLINSGGDVLELTESDFGMVVNTSYFIDIKGIDGFSTDIISDYGNGRQFRVSQAILDSSENLWIADTRFGLVKYNAEKGFEFIAVSGPGTNSAFKLESTDGRLWVASGYPQHPGNWNNSSDFSKRGFYKFFEGQWENYMLPEYPILIEESFSDVAIAYPDPDNPDLAYVGSWQGGMLTVQDGEILTLYNETNSSLEMREEFEGFVGVADIANDNEGNLWMTNGYADEPLSVLRPDGTWESFSLENNFDQSNVLTRLIVNQAGDIWMLHNRGGVVVFSPELANDDDNTTLFKAGDGNGGLPSDNVYSIAEDLDGEIWVGTDDGVAVFYSPFDAFSDNPSEARQILVEQDGIFQFLLEAQSISSIAIDGANRKWIGTFGAGVFLLSEDGTEEILRFTADQSPLFSDVINDIAINDETGEVFIATVEGILSYQGDAIGGEISNECLNVYPNPVRETYAGPITIEGLMRDSEIKITDTRGNLVASFESNGGRGIWDGKNLNGQRVATGVYFALVSNESADSDCVSKILMIK